MIWIIASVPFWLTGGITTVLALVGLGANIMHGDQNSSDDAWTQFKGFTILMGMAGVALSIAAKMVS